MYRAENVLYIWEAFLSVCLALTGYSVCMKLQKTLQQVVIQQLCQFTALKLVYSQTADSFTDLQYVTLRREAT